ncbi:MAG: hypothetical protein ACE5FC_11485, partial [Myxococcota bacterium]
MEFERQRSSHPPGHPIVAYVWVADPDAYARAARDITRGIVPVLAPGDPARKRQWARILRWHGLKQVRGKASRAPARARVASDRNNAVVAMDRQSRPVAALYAAALGRPCLAARAPGRLRRYDSVLFVGAPSAFTMRRIRAFNRSLTVPWGVLTGKDLPALSFLAAKNLAFLGRAARTPLTGFAIDILHQSIIDAGSPYLFARPGALSAPRARRIVRAREAGVLVLHAHGEGGHANLGSIVLCGQSGGVERAQVDDDGGPALDGCSGSGPARSCKRVHSDTVQVVGFDALRVKRFCFLSCNGFSVSGELYPSDVSAVFGCVEGYPAQVLLNDRPTPVTPEVGSTVVRGSES